MQVAYVKQRKLVDAFGSEIFLSDTPDQQEGKASRERVVTIEDNAKVS